MTDPSFRPAPGASGPRGTARAAVSPPTAEEIREALRPPDLPLASPRTVLEAAHRVRDLAAQGRVAEAGVVADAFAAEPADLFERAQLLEAHACALEREGRMADADDVRRELVEIIDGSGLHVMARALVAAHGLRARRGGSHRAEPVTPSARRGRRRADPLARISQEELDDEGLAVLAVVRGTARPAPSRLPRAADLTELEREEGRFLTAIEVLPGVRGHLLGDPEALLRVRYAQVLDQLERDDEATRQALRALTLADRAAGPGAEGEEESVRIATGAHALLARTRRPSDPDAAARHAIDALMQVRLRDDPLLRLDVTADLLLDLMAAGRMRLADGVAPRLASMVRAIAAERDRVRGLLVLAAHRLSSGREDEALAQLDEVRRIVRRSRDHRGRIRADQLLVRVHVAAGRLPEAVSALRDAADAARWLGDDLGATPVERVRHLGTELSARSEAMRLALEVGLFEDAEGQAREILRRILRDAPGVLRPSVRWEHEVDARLGLMLAGAQPGREDRRERRTASLARRRSEAVGAITAAPPGCEERVRYWTVYLTDRDAAMREQLGDQAGALAAARDALAGWRALGEMAHADRVGADIVRLESAGA